MVAVGASLLLAGCSVTDPGPVPSAPASATSTTESSAPSGPVLAPAEKDGRTTIVAVDDKTGSVGLGDFANPAGEGTGRLFVDVLCIGTGTVQLELGGVGSFPLQCTADGSLPTFADVPVTKATFSISVTASADQRWGLRASE